MQRHHAGGEGHTTDGRGSASVACSVPWGSGVVALAPAMLGVLRAYQKVPAGHHPNLTTGIWAVANMFSTLAPCHTSHPRLLRSGHSAIFGQIRPGG